MIDAGWTEIGEKTGLNQGMSGEEMVARMDEAGVDMAISHAIKMPHLNAHVPSEFVAGEVAKFPDRLIGMGSVDLLGGLPGAAGDGRDRRHGSHRHEDHAGA